MTSKHGMTGSPTREDGGMVVAAGSGYEAGPWESFAVAEVGAAAPAHRLSVTVMAALSGVAAGLAVLGGLFCALTGARRALLR